jgi:two-component sensor histidine kinase
MSLRTRVITLLLLLAAPLMMVGVAVSWQDYRFERALPLGHLEMLRQIAASGGRTAVVGLRDLLAAVARSPEVTGGDPAVCTELLSRLTESGAGSYTAAMVADLSGQVWCATPTTLIGSDLAGQTVFVSARRTHGFVVGQSSGATSPQILAAMPLDEGRSPAGEHGGSPADDHGGSPAGDHGGSLVVVGLRPTWFADRILPAEPGLSAWISDPTTPGAAIATAGWLPIFPDTMALPASPALAARLSAGDLVVEGTAAGGTRADFGSVAIGEHLRLIIARDSGAAIAEARGRLRDRTGLLIAFLAAAIGLVVVGADRCIVAPVRRLGRAVQNWRQGQAFQVDQAGHLPPELAGLADSFAAAVERLASREADLKRAVAQQDLAMQEIHHRVKNNLQIVASLLNLQASRIRQPEARAEFQSARDRVRALATLHRHLYVQGELHTIEMHDFLLELCGQLFQAMGETEGDRITLDVEAPSLQMLSDQAVPLALIVTEAVGNALKYAFPGQRSGRITVSLEGSADTARLIVQDNGVGIPAGPAETETGKRDGLGLQLIRGFARQLGAALTVDQGQGTRYVVEMPLRRQREVEEV